jgi:hypothetical protein
MYFERVEQLIELELTDTVCTYVCANLHSYVQSTMHLEFLQCTLTLYHFSAFVEIALAAWSSGFVCAYGVVVVEIVYLQGSGGSIKKYVFDEFEFWSQSYIRLLNFQLQRRRCSRLEHFY